MVFPTRAISGSRMSEIENLGNVTEIVLHEEKINEYVIKRVKYHQALFL
jgi:hypothetical protein